MSTVVAREYTMGLHVALRAGRGQCGYSRDDDAHFSAHGPCFSKSSISVLSAQCIVLHQSFQQSSNSLTGVSPILFEFFHQKTPGMSHDFS